MSDTQAPTIGVLQEEFWKRLNLNPPLLSSLNLGWNGIQLIYHRLPTHELPEFCFPDHIISIYTGRFDVKLTLNGYFQNQPYGEGDMGILPANWQSPGGRCTGQAEYINVCLNPDTFTRMAAESIDTDRVELVSAFMIRDPLIQQIGFALKTELEQGELDSGLYAESMLVALSAHLLRRYSVHRSLFREYHGGLPKHKLREAIAYIHDHLAQDLMLADIASALGMSSHYFASLFKQSTGLAPHQYILKQRIEQAKRLLANQALPITDVLLQVGFKSQSHFTRVFRQQTGMTPKAYRDTL